MEKSLATGHVPTDRIIGLINEQMGTEWPWYFPMGPHDEPSRLMPLTRFWRGDDLKKMLDLRHNGGWIEFDLADRMLCALGLQMCWRDELSDLYLEVNLSPPEQEVIHIPAGGSIGTCLRGECDNQFAISRTGRPRKYCSIQCKNADRVTKTTIGRTRCARLGCTNDFPAPVGRRSQQKYCSDSCRNAASYQNRKDVPRSNLRGPGRKLERLRCMNGHERTAENTTTHTKTGAMVCRDCNREAMRRWRQRKKERAAA